MSKTTAMTPNKVAHNKTNVAVILVGGIGDLAFQLAIISNKLLATNFSIICSEAQFNKISLISNKLSKLNDSLEVLSEINFESIPDYLYKEVLQDFKVNTKKTSTNGPFIAYSHILNRVIISCWVGFSSSVQKIFSSNHTWPATYATYNMISENYMHTLASSSVKSNTHRSMVVMLDANSIFIDAKTLQKFLKKSVRSLDFEDIDNIIYVSNNFQKNDRPDLVRESTKHSLSESSLQIFKEAVKRLGLPKKEFKVLNNPSFKTLLSTVNNSDILFSLRNGMCDLAWIIGKEVLSIYPSLDDFSNYKISRLDEIKFTGNDGNQSPILVHTPNSQSLC